MTIKPDILTEFLVESYENLDRLDGELLALEEDPDAHEVLSSVFRTFHTIKGTCGFLEFAKLEKLTHAGESLLSSLREGDLRMDDSIAESLLRLLDEVRRALSFIEETGEEGGDDGHDKLIALLDSHRQSGAAVGDEPEHADDSVQDTALTDHQQKEGPGDADEPDPGEPRAPRPAAKSPTPAAEATPTTGSIASSNVRVQVEQLDNLMNLAGELVLARNQILQIAAASQDTETLAVAQRLNLVTSELQEGIMKVRMQPIGVLWSQFPRLVRDLSKQCNKSVRLQMEGKDTELDKTLLEAIKDPLTHLVRNAIDHGIGRRDERAENGKSQGGTLLLRAFHESGQVNIEVVDDGQGIDPEAVKAKAVEKGLITMEAADAMGERQALNLIFHAGLSTAKAVTNLSGRGVGMDVVKTNIEEIGGTVDVSSQPGLGTTIRIKIPLTLAIIPALTVSSMGDRYAIPQVSLVELVRLEGQEGAEGIEDLHGSPVYRLRGELLPLVYLERELKLDSTDQGQRSCNARNIVVVRADDQQFGLIVDEIHNTEEIVVKSLDRQIKSISVYAGTTILGDGRVALILDILGLAQHAGVVSEERHERLIEVDDEAAGDSQEISTYLMLQVGNNQRVAARLSSVDRLEEFSRDQIEHTGRQEVVQYRDRIMPLVDISAALGLDTAGQPGESEGGPIKVVVHTQGSQSVGLVVDDITDIVEGDASVLRNSNASGIQCAVVIDEKVTDLLDLDALLQHVLVDATDAASQGQDTRSDATTHRQFCTFHLGDLFFGVDVMHVQEVMRHQNMTQVPLTSPVVQGVINLRGQTVTALDMRKRLDLPPRFDQESETDPECKPMNLVLNTQDGVVSLLVDRVGDVVTVDNVDRANIPNTVGGQVRDLLTGVYKLPGSLLLILDIEKLGAVDGGVPTT